MQLPFRYLLTIAFFYFISYGFATFIQLSMGQDQKGTHTCVYKPHIIYKRFNDRFFSKAAQVPQKFRTVLESFPIVRNERWVCTADLWVETSPSTNDSLLCSLRLHKKIVELRLSGGETTRIASALPTFVGQSYCSVRYFW